VHLVGVFKAWYQLIDNCVKVFHQKGAGSGYCA
jgi:hypothetical protein